ncbi:hypothetical protein [Sulfitobacter sp.]|uniref:hypothetical protein n=1 Tax=Sulfitobacter sp. TaxID=1903071 RepID=UPI0032979709
MQKFYGLAAAAALGLMAALPTTALADVKIYPYASSENYCPAGLQPVTISGVICCGTPNTGHTYQSVKAHPVAQKKHHKVVRKTYLAKQSHCPIGTKGCTFD